MGFAYSDRSSNARTGGWALDPSILDKARIMLAGTARRGLPPVRGKTRIWRLLLGRPQGRIDVTFGPDLHFKLNLADIDQLYTALFTYEPPALGPLLDRVLDEGDLFVDVGANQGVYSCWAAKRVGPSGAVHAFEPIPEIRELLERNIVRNDVEDRIEVHGVALGAENGTITIHAVPNASGLSGFRRHQEPGAIPTDVPLTSMDLELSSTGPVRLVKIDVEGYETHVLRGMSTMATSERPPIVALELCDEYLRRCGSSAAELLGLAARLGYTTWSITPRGLRILRGLYRGQNVVLLRPGHHDRELSDLQETNFPYDFSA